jgi:hypothetical protein
LGDYLVEIYVLIVVYVLNLALVIRVSITLTLYSQDRWYEGFHSLALAIVKGHEIAENITFNATAEELQPAFITLKTK